MLQHGWGFWYRGSYYSSSEDYCNQNLNGIPQGVYYDSFNQNYHNYAGGTVSYNQVYDNYLAPNVVASLSGSDLNEGWNIYSFSYWNQTNYIYSQGDPGAVNINNGGLDFSNPTVSSTSISLWGEYAAGQGGNFSLASLYSHFQVGGGDAMTFNMSSVNFGGATLRDLGLTGMKVNDIRRVNLFDAGPLNQAALAFGRVRMQYHGNDQFSIVGDKSAEFNFSPLIDFDASMGRNAGNILGAAINYNLMISPAAALVPLIFGGSFPVYFNGTTTIPK